MSELSYYSPNGSLPKFSLQGRWSSNPEPVQQRLVNGQEQRIYDPWLVYQGRWRDIASGAPPEAVAVAVKVKGDDDSYAFHGESYVGDMFRVEALRLPRGTSELRVRVISGEVRRR